MGVRILISLVAGAVVMLALVLWRHFYWQHALLTALAAGALVFTSLRTVEKLRDLYRRE